MNDTHKFHCNFGAATCTIEFSPSEHRPGNPVNIRPNVVWTGMRTPGMFPQYMAWIHSVNAVISKVINQQFIFVIQDWSSDPPHWEFWVYQPDGSKKCVLQEDGTFQKSWVGR